MKMSNDVIVKRKVIDDSSYNFSDQTSNENLGKNYQVRKQMSQNKILTAKSPLPEDS